MSVILTDGAKIFRNTDYVKNSTVFTGTLYEFTKSGYFQVKSGLIEGNLLVWTVSGGENGKAGSRFKGGEGGMGGEFVLEYDFYNICGSAGGDYLVTIGNEAFGNTSLNRHTYITDTSGNSFGPIFQNGGKGGQYGGEGVSLDFGQKTYYFSGGGGSASNRGRDRSIGGGNGLLLAKNGSGVYGGPAGAGYGGGGGGGDIGKNGGSGARGIFLLLDINSSGT